MYKIKILELTRDGTDGFSFVTFELKVRKFMFLRNKEICTAVYGTSQSRGSTIYRDISDGRSFKVEICNILDNLVYADKVSRRFEEARRNKNKTVNIS